MHKAYRQRRWYSLSWFIETLIVRVENMPFQDLSCTVAVAAVFDTPPGLSGVAPELLCLSHPADAASCATSCTASCLSGCVMTHTWILGSVTGRPFCTKR